MGQLNIVHGIAFSVGGCRRHREYRTHGWRCFWKWACLRGVPSFLTLAYSRRLPPGNGSSYLLSLSERSPQVGRAWPSVDHARLICHGG